MSLRPPPSPAVFSAPTRRPLRIAAGALGYGPIEVDSGPVPPPTAAPPVPVGDPPHPKTRKTFDDPAAAPVSGLVADEELFARPAAEAEFFGPPQQQDDWNDWNDKTDQDLDQGQGPGDERFGGARCASRAWAPPLAWPTYPGLAEQVPRQVHLGGAAADRPGPSKVPRHEQKAGQ